MSNDYEISTDMLTERLVNSTSASAYVKSMPACDESLTGYLQELLSEHATTKAAVIRESGLNATFCYQIFSGTRKPGRETCLALAFGLHVTLPEAQRLLTRAGVSRLWPKSPRDAVVMYAIAHGLDLQAANESLFSMGFETVGRSDS